MQHIGSRGTAVPTRLLSLAERTAHVVEAVPLVLQGEQRRDGIRYRVTRRLQVERRLWWLRSVLCSGERRRRGASGRAWRDDAVRESLGRAEGGEQHDEPHSEAIDLAGVWPVLQ